MSVAAPKLTSIITEIQKRTGVSPDLPVSSKGSGTPTPGGSAGTGGEGSMSAAKLAAIAAKLGEK